ncbi:MAG: DUF1788 domain-containing protein [Lachnospiraceae bacterium]|nr:DUF1788 domain-containing protein [Lachnospiraceae bacterium]
MTSSQFYARLEQVPDRLLSKDLLHNIHIGNEIGFYIFDYPPDKELVVREWLPSLPEQVNKKSEQKITLLSINIFQEVIRYIKNTNKYEKIIQVEKERGNDATLRGLGSLLNTTAITSIFKDVINTNADIILMHGVGAAWPLIRIHSFLNILQPIVERVPLVLFYPGTYNSSEIKLFNRLPSENYYRAFRLLP